MDGKESESSESGEPVEIVPRNGFQKYTAWLSKITVEPVMFFYMFAFSLTSVVEQAFYVDKACRVNLNYTEEICTNLHEEKYKEWNIKVQKVVSNFYQYNQIATHAVPIILAFFLGSWSDRRGRKIIILMGLFGKLYFSCMIVVNALQETWNVEMILWTACAPSAITGADLAIFAGVFAYISDVTSPEDRTFRVAILDVVYLSTLPTGVALGKYLYVSVTHRSFATMFAINASMLVIAIICTFWLLKWQSTERQEALCESNVNCCCDFFDWRHVTGSFRALLRKRPGRRRMYLLIIIISMMFYTFQRDEKPLTYLYTILQFGWTAEVYSDFKTYQSSAYVIGTLIGVPIMSRWLKLEDTIIIMIGSAAHGCARFFYAFAKVSWLFYIGATIAALGPVVAPVLRSMISKVVPIDERGKVFAILAVADNAVPLFSGVIYSQVYNASIDTLPTAIFWVTFCSQTIVFVLAIIVHFSVRKYPLEIAESANADRLSSSSNEDGTSY